MDLIWHMVSLENFLKSMPPSLWKLKVTPSFCFPFKIPDNPIATNIMCKCISGVLEEYWAGISSKIRIPPKWRLHDLFQACTHAALPDFLTFRQPYFYQKLPLMVHWLLSFQRKPKVVTLCVYKLARDLRG